MERGAFIRTDRSPLATILLLICMFTPTLTLLHQSETEMCLDVEYLNENGICCNKCFPGFRLAVECNAPHERSNCTPCPTGQYMDKVNYARNCKKCRICRNLNVLVTPCERHRNTVCRCKDGYYRSYIDSETYECIKCKCCDLNQKESQRCTPEKNTVCENDYYRNKNSCTAECESHCSVTPMPSRGNESKNGCLYNFIGVATGALGLLLLATAITYVVTKRFTLRKLQNSSSQSSDVSPDPCEEILIRGEESSFDISIKVATVCAFPLSECEQSNKLPDCIPVEIKISDLIYTVLDLVPVLQVKQLARSLGVRDAEIEQVELDYRSCREAHYQMLRAWAARGSVASVLLHPPLLQDLLNELRKMHLEQAAEELELNYGFT